MDSYFINFFKSQFEKHDIFKYNKELYSQFRTEKRCSWEEDSLKIREKYLFTLDTNDEHIKVKNYANNMFLHP